MERETQIKSKKRIVEHGEVFTSDREVKAMLDLVKDETQRIESRFLEPACGNGNFLVEILRRKLEIVSQRYGKNKLDFERYAVIAVGSIYGVELLIDNVIECRERLFSILFKFYSERFSCDGSQKYREAIRFILNRNILCGDALTLKTTEGKPIVFSEWSLVSGSNIKRRDYTFTELMEANRVGQMSIFQAAMRFDDKALGFIQDPVKEYPITHYEYE